MAASAPRLLFVTYHYVRDPGQYAHPGIHPISPEAFAAQVAALRARYRFPSPEEVEAFFAGERSLPADSVFPTFDDGLADHWTACREVLDPLGVKGAFFVCSRPALERRALGVHKVHWLRAHTEPAAFAEELRAHLPPERRPRDDEPWHEAAERTYVYDTPAVARLKFALNFLLPADLVDEATSRMLAERGIDEGAFCDRAYMSDEQLRALREAGHVVGVHGHEHRPFAELGADLFLDVGRDVDYIARATGVAPTWVSYPYGRKEAIPDADARAALFAAFGFRLGLTLLGDWNRGDEDPTLVSRINTNEVERATAPSRGGLGA